jgi:hypothetical protein
MSIDETGGDASSIAPWRRRRRSSHLSCLEQTRADEIDTLASMSRLFSQSLLVPAWFIIGVLTLQAPPPTISMVMFLLVSGAVIVPFAIVSLGLKWRPVGASLVVHDRSHETRVAREWLRIAEGDAGGIVCVHGDKG